MPLKALIVMPTPDATWVREMSLPIPPFPGLGIRIAVYEILNVDSVVVGDRGYDVTCIVHLEDVEPASVTPAKCEALGFVIGAYP